jgi:hypothetical protein
LLVCMERLTLAARSTYKEPTTVTLQSKVSKGLDSHDHYTALDTHGRSLSARGDILLGTSHDLFKILHHQLQLGYLRARARATWPQAPPKSATFAPAGTYEPSCLALAQRISSWSWHDGAACEPDARLGRSKLQGLYRTRPGSERRGLLNCTYKSLGGRPCYYAGQDHRISQYFWGLRYGRRHQV